MRISGWDWADKRWLVRPSAGARRENLLAVAFVVVLLVAAVAAVACLVLVLVLAVAVARMVLLVLGVATWAI